MINKVDVLYYTRVFRNEGAENLTPEQLLATIAFWGVGYIPENTIVLGTFLSSNSAEPAAVHDNAVASLKRYIKENQVELLQYSIFNNYTLVCAIRLTPGMDSLFEVLWMKTGVPLYL